ncbi:MULTISPECIES: hypothetical protein [Streptomyces]|uniref:hypothetical protein n=2 Tax=Streptomyces TaxID=1883 RepID=UPI00089117D2|nr:MULTISPECIES: hypothetical protein [unclassified Streptomyces]MBD3544544.1 hypothetical protein [Streptomyces sp. JV180]MYW79859.1 hypothetical protein [Streptomyces sp. SID8369]NEA12931.1 hypothetical protein [Streptomyces sp. SID10692]SDD57497.1 hypothetical protein F610DRAFT_04790 [Streptomyces sp. LaPpAH-199]
MIRGMFRYAFLAAPSAVADAPKAAGNDAVAVALAPAASAAVAATAALAAAGVAAASTAAAAPIGGARS